MSGASGLGLQAANAVQFRRALSCGAAGRRVASARAHGHRPRSSREPRCRNPAEPLAEPALRPAPPRRSSAFPSPLATALLAAFSQQQEYPEVIITQRDTPARVQLGQTRRVSRPPEARAGQRRGGTRLPRAVHGERAHPRRVLFGCEHCIITVFQTLINPLFHISKQHTSHFSTESCCSYLRINSVPQTNTLASSLNCVS